MQEGEHREEGRKMQEWRGGGGREGECQGRQAQGAVCTLQPGEGGREVRCLEVGGDQPSESGTPKTPEEEGLLEAGSPRGTVPIRLSVEVEFRSWGALHGTKL